MHFKNKEFVKCEAMGASDAVGFLSCAICAIFFGSVFVPLKHIDTKDGMFVQLVMGFAIFCMGLLVGIYEKFESFYPLAMLGGALWATGNITAVPIINRIGIALGMLLWNFTNLLSGWASGRFGWFGIHPQVPQNEMLNYFGLALSLISTIMFGFVKNEPNENDMQVLGYELVKKQSKAAEDEASCIDTNDNSSQKYHQRQRMLTILTCIIAGIFYGLCYAPVTYIRDNTAGAPKGALPYVFAFCCGICATSTAYFVFYALYNQQKQIYMPEAILPAFAAGVIWAIGQTACLIAIESLSEAVSFPIITRFPGLIATLWGVFVFKEIPVKGPEGRKISLILGIGAVLTVLGGVLSGLSK